MLKGLALFLLWLHCAVAGAQLYYPPVSGDAWETADPAALGWCQDSIDSLYRYLEKTQTKAFIVLKDGRIALEKYFGTFNKDSMSVWNSAGKTLTAFAIGIAQREGDLDIDDPTSFYLQRWSSLTAEQERKITLRHHLTMTTGLDDSVANNDCTDPECLVYGAEPGTRWAYDNAPYTLLQDVLETATGMSLNQWVNQKIKAPTGMTGTYFDADYNSIYISNARSMARFGLLLQSGGSWAGKSLLRDDAYFYEMTHASQPLNPSYGYLTWLNGQTSYRIPGSQTSYLGWILPHAPFDLFSADGKDGQFINIVPSQGLVLIRMGNASGGSKSPTSYNDTIWQYVNRLSGRGCKKVDEAR